MFYFPNFEFCNHVSISNYMVVFFSSNNHGVFVRIFFKKTKRSLLHVTCLISQLKSKYHEKSIDNLIGFPSKPSKFSNSFLELSDYLLYSLNCRLDVIQFVSCLLPRLWSYLVNFLIFSTNYWVSHLHS